MPEGAQRMQPASGSGATAVRERLSSGWERRREPHLRGQFVLVTVFALGLGSFLNLAEDYENHEAITRWDVEFSRWLHVHSSGTLTSVFDVVTWLGNVIVLALVVAGVCLWLLRRGRFNEAALVAVSAAGIELLNGGLKLLFHRPRPALAYVHLDTYSFPSGHATGIAAIYGVVIAVLASRLRSRSAQAAAAAGYVVLVSVVAFSRLYLEVHYLSDVLAGLSLGAAWAAGSLFVYRAKRNGDVRRVLPAPVGDALARLASKS